MSTHRQLIAERIKADNPDFIVKAYPAPAPDNLGRGKVQVSVWRESIKPDQLTLQSSLTIEVLCNGGYTIATEDALDVALDEVILSLERIPGVLWSDAVRTTFDDKYVGYQVTVSLSGNNVYKTIVREEQKAVTP